MATESEEVLSLVLACLRATDLARGRAASRGVRSRCQSVVAAATRVEALLCAGRDVDRMVEDACGSLRVQCEPGCVIFLHTRFRGVRTCTEKLLAALLERGVLPRGVRALRAQTYGLVGKTASGHMLEIEEAAGILVVVLPKALAEVSLGVEALHSESEMEAEGPRADDLATTVIAQDSQEVMTLFETWHDEERATANFFGGIAEGKIQEMRDSSFATASTAMIIRWRAQSAAAQPQRGLSAVHVQTMANRSGPAGSERRSSSAALIKAQKEQLDATTGGLPVQTVALFACNGRGASWYGETSVEADLLNDAYREEPIQAGRQPPAVWGMFCGGELGPKVEDDSDSDSDSQSPRGSPRRVERSSACHVNIAAAAPALRLGGEELAAGSPPATPCCEWQGFTSVVAVFA